MSVELYSTTWLSCHRALRQSVQAHRAQGDLLVRGSRPGLPRDAPEHPDRHPHHPHRRGHARCRQGPHLMGDGHSHGSGKLTELDHVGIAVRDLDAVVEWYEKMFGATVAHRERIESDRSEERRVGKE